MWIAIYKAIVTAMSILNHLYCLYFSLVLSAFFYFLSWYLYKPEEQSKSGDVIKDPEALENGKETKL
jgi:hypothetical protein